MQNHTLQRTIMQKSVNIESRFDEVVNQIAFRGERMYRLELQT